MLKITEENWTYCHFKSNNLKAFIAIAGQFKQEAVEVCYTLTVLSEDEKEVYCKSFPQVLDAIAYANERYGHWTMVDGRVASEGCGTCSAH